MALVVGIARAPHGLLSPRGPPPAEPWDHAGGLRVAASGSRRGSSGRSPGPRLPPADAGPAPLAAIKWLVKEMQVSACGRAAAAGDVGWAPGERGEAAERREPARGGAGRRAPPRPAPPRPRPRPRPERPRPRLAPTVARCPRLRGSRAARRPPRGSRPAGPPSAPPPQPPPLARRADRRPRRGERRYFAGPKQAFAAP